MSVFMHIRGNGDGTCRWIAAAAVLLLMIPASHAAGALGDSTRNRNTEEAYRIDQPGTITFTVGVKISGKVEKPQVMIFLPKEKTQYRDEVFNRSFIDELSQPLPFSPVLK